MNPIQARYILPSFIEHSSYGVKESNPYNKLFEERIIFLGVQVDDASANDVMAQLLVLESLDPDRDITMYINSPGGSFTSLMAIYDTMQYVRADIQTVCLGQAASAAAVLLAAGTPGKRLALPNARILIHQPAVGGAIQGQVSDLEIQAAEIERMRTLMETTLARHTGKDAEVIRKDIDRDKILTAAEAKEYGIIDDGAGVPQAVGAEVSDRRRPGPIESRSGSGGDTPGTRLGVARPASRIRGYVLRDETNPPARFGPSLADRAGIAGSVGEHRVRSDPRWYRRRRGSRDLRHMARIGDGGDLLKCSFCGKSQKQVKKLIAGPGVYICDECIDLCNEIIEEELAEADEVKLDELPKPAEIREFLDQYVIGQDTAKRTLAVAVYNHYKRIQAGEKGRESRGGARRAGQVQHPDARPDRLRQDLPGADAGQDAQRAVRDRRRHRADRGRLRRRGRREHPAQADPGRRLRRQARRDRHHLHRRGRQDRPQEREPVDHPRRLRRGCAAGAAEDPRGHPGRRCRRRADASTRTRSSSRSTPPTCCSSWRVRSPGWRRSSPTGSASAGSASAPRCARKAEIDTQDLFSEVMPEDLIKFGLIPEFIGRLPVVASVTNLDKESLVKILSEPKNALVKQYPRLFEMDGVELEFTDDALDAIADQAILRGTGARGLRAIMEEVLLPVMYDIPSRDDVAKVVVTEETVQDNVLPTIVPRKPSRAERRDKSA